MSKKQAAPDHRKLTDRLSPDATYGRLLGVWTTTYEMQVEFFETDFLPTLLGLGAWDDRNWTSRIALEKQLAELEAASVLFDARPYRGRPRSLRVEAVPVHFDGGRLLHAKIVLAVYDRAIRLFVGSANLTEPGYRRNREVVAVLDASERRPAEARLISEAIESMPTSLSAFNSTSATELFSLASQRLGAWRKSELPQSEWFAWSGDTVPLWQQVLNRWPRGKRIQRIRVVSPFWSEEKSHGPITRFLTHLKSADQLEENAELQLLTEAAPDKQATYKPRLPESFGDFDSRAFDVRAFAVAVDPRVPPEEVNMGEDFTGTRALHAKVVLLEGENTALAYLGSANFTNRGWGFLPATNSANIEAGIVLLREGASTKDLATLIPVTTGEAIPLAGAAAGKLAIPEPEPEVLPWPVFVEEVLLAPSADEAHSLELVVRIKAAAVEGVWSISFASPTDEAGETLLNGGETQQHPDTHVKTLSQVQLARLLRDQEIHVRWWACEPGRTFPVNVSPEARTSLPISPGSKRPAENHLIAYYQGQISWEDLFPDPTEGTREKSSNEAADDESGVDTSRIQSYVVREFVEALKGINDDLKSAALASKACMRLALLGSVSPVALARRVADAASTGRRSPTAAGFQLVEILASLDAARSNETAPAFADDWTATIEEASQVVRKLVDGLVDAHQKELSGDFKKYVKALSSLHQGTSP